MNSLKPVDGLRLGTVWQDLLKPGQPLRATDGTLHHLPRFFFEVPTWAAAGEIRAAPHFRLSELMTVDCRENDRLLKQFPHYVPCAILILAGFLERFRLEVSAPVFVSVNGGYRSPAHELNRPGSRHQWGTAADIYRVGDTYLDDEKAIEKFREMATELGPAINARPYAEGDDHLHIDLGFVTVVPPEIGEEV